MIEIDPARKQKAGEGCYIAAAMYGFTFIVCTAYTCNSGGGKKKAA